jgi:electron transfer flavoprotein beta subunit
MKIIVCVKQVPDPEVPPAKFRIDAAAKQVAPSGLPPVMSIFDARACEAALRLKDKDKAGTQITVLSMGPGKVIDVVRYGLSMGADEGVVLQDPIFDGSDSFGTAAVLAQAIRKIGAFDLVLCGRQAADWEAGQVGPLLAELLGIPLVTLASDIQKGELGLRIRRVLGDGYEELDVSAPCLVTVSGEIGLHRLPKGIEIVRAASKKIPVWTGADIGLDPSLAGAGAAHTEVTRLEIPVREVNCQVITGESPADTAAKLVAALRKAGVV